MIPYGRQDISEADVRAVVDVLHSDFLTQGAVVPRFEQAVVDYCGALHAVAMSSATSALHVACMALELGPEDMLWTSPNTFVASANCGLYCGAKVDFVDIDPHTYNMSSRALKEKLAAAEKQGKLPKVVIPVHFAGQACEMREIRSLADHFGFHIIEDASHAIGGKYLEERIGNCRYSDITIFSFHPVKIITTGEGGMALTNHPGLAEKMRLLRSHGITRDPEQMTGKSEGSWYYQQIELGYNYRMTDMQAALGISQLQRIEGFIERRREIAEYYDAAFSSLPISTPKSSDNVLSAWHLYVVQIDETRTGKTRKEVFDALRTEGIQVNVHYIPVHMQPYYSKLGFALGDFPIAEQYYGRAISLPIFSSLPQHDLERVVSAFKAALQI